MENETFAVETLLVNMQNVNNVLFLPPLKTEMHVLCSARTNDVSFIGTMGSQSMQQPAAKHTH